MENKTKTACETCAHFNADGLLIGKHNQSPINATVHKTSAGNSFAINIGITSLFKESLLLKPYEIKVTD